MILTLSTIILISGAVLPAAADVKSVRRPATVADFGTSAYTTRQGFFRCIGADPNQVADLLTDLGSPPVDCWRIDIAANAPSGNAGALIPFGDETAVGGQDRVRIQPDVEFQLRMLGDLGQRVLNIELAPAGYLDGRGILLGKVEARDIDANQWRTIRMKALAAVGDQHEAGYLRIKAEGAGPAWFAIDRIDATGLAEDEFESVRTPPPHRIRTAMWAWRRREILPDPALRAELVAFCTRRHITDLFMQIPYVYDSGKVTIELVDEQRSLNAAAQSHGITVHALDGHPTYVLRENHERMSALLVALDEFNRQASENERYSAVHLDNEPYVLKDWRPPDRRREIIRDYVELQKRMGTEAHRFKLQYGIDIPFWFDVKNREGQSRFTVQTESGEVALLDAIFPHLDNVGIMSYRERVLGNDGVVAHCMNEFALGERFGVAVFASVELGTGADVEPRISMGRYPLGYFNTQWETLKRVLPRMTGCAGIAIHYYGAFKQLEEQS